MRHTYVAGTATTTFGRHPDKTLIDLAVEAGEMAIADSGLERSEIDAVYFGNFLGRGIDGQGVIASLLALRLGLAGVATTNVEGACGSAGIALRHGVLSVAAGAATATLCIGAEHMTRPGTQAITKLLTEAGEMATDGAAGLTFPGFFGLVANAHAARYGSTRDDLAAVVMQNRACAVANPNAMFRETVSADQIASGKLIADPLRLLDCSPISDGAAAVVVTDWAHATSSRNGAVRVLACEQTSGPVGIRHMETLTSFPATVTAAQRAYKSAGLGPRDIDVVELHDCFSITELVNVADLGFFAHGEAHTAIAEGLTTNGSPGVVVNPSGGLLGRGHPVGATGLAQVHEVVGQLRGTAANQLPAAHVGMAHNLGGAGATATVTILGAA
ncbi:thiolase domain-containing protein [Kribbella capetownensis]|uniref:Thiolase domain-containing protein n=1 Tax=Kribbella capetownensis TaxID=1572659 RepID=A0A4R0IU08_9ACTN|nr:thiolase domain-containing protein [Kribbella capetownensis]TCC37393.1 thiolase domain-containing protein [Kribbella capetownensis]